MRFAENINCTSHGRADTFTDGASVDKPETIKGLITVVIFPSLNINKAVFINIF